MPSELLNLSTFWITFHSHALDHTSLSSRMKHAFPIALVLCLKCILAIKHDDSNTFVVPPARGGGPDDSLERNAFVANRVATEGPMENKSRYISGFTIFDL